eukprot:TRINITY_DN2572_c0_g1_i1.p1 TRINITY_DN2572_c0_g1~~TRINITY_DN2572_c0_g1_i1.p1  ORF type:complete len:194 (-),score=39.41 TRINITY_DN2572_c0_g1_i1:73-654(-)
MKQTTWILIAAIIVPTILGLSATFEKSGTICPQRLLAYAGKANFSEVAFFLDSVSQKSNAPVMYYTGNGLISAVSYSSGLGLIAETKHKSLVGLSTGSFTDYQSSWTSSVAPIPGRVYLLSSFKTSTTASSLAFQVISVNASYVDLEVGIFQHIVFGRGGSDYLDILSEGDAWVTLEKGNCPSVTQKHVLCRE